MPEPMLFNPQAKVQLHWIAPENAVEGESLAAPLLVIDDCLSSPESLVNAACQATFERDSGDFYPGVRAPLPQQYIDAMSTTLSEKLRAILGLTHSDAKCVFSAFSVANQAEKSLKPIQCIPHFDDTCANKFAVVHYLFQQDHGGTGFFQHRKTGYCSISAQNQNHYMKTLGTQATTQGLPALQYIQGSTDLFQEYHRVAARFNRAIVYPCNLLHSGIINPDFALSSLPEQGRLTANLALQIDAG
ncbi:DUF6445 family protein [Planctobacterium marinum]|uniref:Uncharacterized protein n=1 Tax=Planctobacterium marinum TaxID=1631968 RepID=A0AA48HHX1_9ALTE|nr:hypothetical protein MACH26_05120 [Planctobacterium marinum]